MQQGEHRTRVLRDANGNKLVVGASYRDEHGRTVEYLGRASSFNPDGRGALRAYVRWGTREYNMEPCRMVPA